MYKLTVLYGKPTDPAAFDEYYRGTHVPLAQKMQGTSLKLCWVSNQDGPLSESIHLIAEVTAADEATLMGALDSPDGKAAAGDVPNFATGGATFLFGSVEDAVAG